MNLNTLNPSARVLKRLQNCASGQNPTGAKDGAIIGLVVAGDTYETKKLCENAVAGIRAKGGIVYTFAVPYFNYANKINPLTAKMAPSFRAYAKTTINAIVKTNMLEGVVIVTDCDVTCAGLLHGCIEQNTPVMVLPLGAAQIQNISGHKHNVTKIAGMVAAGTITGAQSDEIIAGEFMPKHQSGFFGLLEKLGFVVAGAGSNKRGSGLQLSSAVETGIAAVQNTTEIKLPKKVFTKQNLVDVTDFALLKNYTLGDIELIGTLFAACDVQMPPEFIFERIAKLGKPCNTAKVTGTALGGTAYVQYKTERPAPFEGRAWVYQNLEDADRAVCSSSIPPQSVIVLQNCVGVDVTAIVNVICGADRTDIAVATDGTCELTDVLVVQIANPNSFANEEFANIQNGDQLEIDPAKGRFNSNVLSKDLKNRAKRNGERKPVIYF